MAATINTAGNTALRQFVYDNWNKVQVYDNAGTPVLLKTYAFGVDSGAVISWEDDNADGDNIVTIKVVITGAMFLTDGTTKFNGKTVGGAKLVNASNTSMVDVTYDSPFTFQNDADTLTIKITVQVG